MVTLKDLKRDLESQGYKELYSTNFIAIYYRQRILIIAFENEGLWKNHTEVTIDFIENARITSHPSIKGGVSEEREFVGEADFYVIEPMPNAEGAYVQVSAHHFEEDYDGWYNEDVLARIVFENHSMEPAWMLEHVSFEGVFDAK